MEKIAMQHILKQQVVAKLAMWMEEGSRFDSMEKENVTYKKKKGRS